MRHQRFGFALDLVEFVAEPREVALEAGNDGLVDERRPVAFDPPPAFGQHRGQAAGALAHRLESHEGLRQVAGAGGGERSLGADHVGVESSERRLERGLGVGQFGPGFDTGRRPGRQGSQLPPCEVEPEGAEFFDQRSVTAGGVGLAFEGTKLAADLAEEVLEAEEVGLGRLETTLGLLPPLAVFEDAGGLLDDAAAILGPGVEHGVDLALADDHVLLAADPAVAEQFLDVEEPTRGPVDGVLAVAAAKQGAGDRDLGETDVEDAVSVVDGQAHLGPAQRRLVGGPGEDDVFHLRAAHRPGPLGAEHPGHGIDHIGLAASVGADHHRDPRLELERRGLGEGLEAFDGEGLQEHWTTRLPVPAGPVADDRFPAETVALATAGAGKLEARVGRGGQIWQRGQLKCDRPLIFARTIGVRQRRQGSPSWS